MSVDQVGADVGTPPVDQVKCEQRMACPSIRLVPTSAPQFALTVLAMPYHVSVDQVGADVGTRQKSPHHVQEVIVSVDQVGADVGTHLVETLAADPVWRVSVDQVGADVGTRLDGLPL